MNIKDCKTCGYILIIFLTYVFYVLGLIISDLIDLNFDKLDETKHDQYIMIEIIIEVMIAYIIRVTFQRYQKELLNPLFSVFNMKPPEFVFLLIPMAFIVGVYQQLKNSNEKMLYMFEKYSNKESVKKYVTQILNKYNLIK